MDELRNPQDLRQEDQTSYGIEEAPFPPVPTPPADYPEAPVYSDGCPAPAAQKKSSKTGLFLAIGAAVVLAAAAAVFFLLSSSPMGLVVKGIQNTAAGWAENPLLAVINDVAQDGSVEVRMGLDALTGNDALSGDACVKLYSSDDQSAGLTAAVDMGLVTMDISLLSNADELVLSSPVLLGDSAYGIRWDTAAENFDSSVFGPEGQFSLGISYEELKNYIPSQSSGQQQAPSAQTSEAVNDFLNTVGKSLREHAKIGKEKQTLTFGAETCKTTAVSISLDAQATYAVVVEVLEYLDGHPEVWEALCANSGTYMSGQNINSQIEHLKDELAEALENKDEILESLNDAQFEAVLTFYISKAGKYLVGFALDIHENDENTQLECYIGPNPGDISQISLKMKDSDDDLKLTYTVNTDDEKKYDASLKVRENKQDVFVADLTWDKVTGNAQLAVEQEEELTTLDGSIRSQGDLWLICVESAEKIGETKTLGLSLTLDTSDEMPPIPEYEDILAMSAEDVQKIITGIAFLFQGLS